MIMHKQKSQKEPENEFCLYHLPCQQASQLIIVKKFTIPVISSQLIVNYHYETIDKLTREKT